MGETPNIEDVEAVEVGKFYLVPTVRMLHAPKALSLIPIIGPLHEDVEFIRFPDRHWHPDRRFISEAWMQENGSSHWGIVVAPKARQGYVSAVDAGRRRLKCKRLIASFSDRSGKPPHWLMGLEGAYQNERLRDGHICPHRGISCRGVVAESDGGVVCPGHGLKWGKDGNLVSRIGQEFSQQRLFPQSKGSEIVERYS